MPFLLHLLKPRICSLKAGPSILIDGLAFGLDYQDSTRPKEFRKPQKQHRVSGRNKEIINLKTASSLVSVGLAGWLVGWLAGWLAAGLLAGCWLAGLLLGGWFAGWLAGWLAG